MHKVLKSGASDSEIHNSIEEFKEKFADYGRDRRSAMEFHLRNAERLLMPTTTTSIAMRALEGGGSNSTSKNEDTNNATRSRSTLPSAGGGEQFNKEKLNNTDPKELFKYLVNFLDVTPEQAAALKDSRHVAKELDEALATSLSMLEELKDRLTTVGQDLDAEFSEIRSILTPRQAAKFLVWVANNGGAFNATCSSTFYGIGILSRLTLHLYLLF